MKKQTISYELLLKLRELSEILEDCCEILNATKPHLNIREYPREVLELWNVKKCDWCKELYGDDDLNELQICRDCEEDAEHNRDV